MSQNEMNTFIPHAQYTSIGDPSEQASVVKSVEAPTETSTSQQPSAGASMDEVKQPQVEVENPVAEKKEEPVPQQPTEEVSSKTGEFGQDLPALEFKTPPHNVVIARPTTRPGETTIPETVFLPSASYSTQDELVRGMPNIKSTSDRGDAEWAQTFFQGQLNTPLEGDLDKALSRENSLWRQGIEVNGETIRSSVPRFNTPSNAKLEGAQALQAAFSHMQLGDIFHTAMWNSGFWVTFKPAPDSIWITINRLLGTEVMGISRDTYGLLHSTATSLAVQTIINNILPYVYATSVNIGEMAFSDIPQYLSSADEHDFIWGFIAANYPRGFNIERACVANPADCRHVIKEVIDVRELQIVDNEKLPEPLRHHMRSRAAGSMSLKSVTEYQDKLNQINDSVITLKTTSGLEATVKLSTPSVRKKAYMADQYVESTHQDVLRAVTNDTPVSQRVALYNEYTTSTEMRLYQHWVKEIGLGTNSIEGEDDIAGTLGLWTRDPELRTQFFDGVRNFINNSSLSVIALEAAHCPACGKSHSRPEQKLRGRIDCIPIDIIQLFSNLAEFKTRLVSAR